MASLLSMSFVSSESEVLCNYAKGLKKETPKENTPSDQPDSLEKAIEQAVVPGLKFEIQKIAILFREILFDETNEAHQFTEQKIILPKLLQTLLTTAIQKNAP